MTEDEMLERMIEVPMSKEARACVENAYHGARTFERALARKILMSLGLPTSEEFIMAYFAGVTRVKAMLP